MTKLSLLITIVTFHTAFIMSGQNVHFVENSNDNGAGSLRQIIEESANGDTIRFLQGIVNVNLNSGELLINKSLSIIADTNVTIIRVGDGKFRIIHFTGQRLYLKNITITNGLIPYYANSKHGGGICADQSNSRLFLVNCTISDNTARKGTSSSYNGGSGGGIYAHYLNLVNCRITGNSSGNGLSNPTGPPGLHGDGGNGGGICCDSLVMINCLVFNNKSGAGGYGQEHGSEGGDGGGVCFGHRGQIINSTIVNNIANSGGFGLVGYWGLPGKGGGVYHYYYEEAFLTNSIIAYNLADTLYGTYGNSDLFGTYNAQYTLVLDTANFTLNGYNNLIGISPEFTDPPNDFTPMINSPAVNGGTPDTSGLFLPEIDLLGNLRISEDTVDIGAFEYQYITYINSIKDTKPVLIFPNPNNGLFWVTSNVNSIEKLEIFSYSGKKIKEIKPDIQPYHINISDCPKGIYIIVIKNGADIYSEKVVIR